MYKKAVEGLKECVNNHPKQLWKEAYQWRERSLFNSTNPKAVFEEVILTRKLNCIYKVPLLFSAVQRVRNCFKGKKWFVPFTVLEKKSAVGKIYGPDRVNSSDEFNFGNGLVELMSDQQFKSYTQQITEVFKERGVKYTGPLEEQLHCIEILFVLRRKKHLIFLEKKQSKNLREC